MSTAPEDVRFCLTCGGSMTTLDVHGTARRVCTACRSIHYVDPKVAVGVAVFRDHRLLLVRRVMEPGRGRWTVRLLAGRVVELGLAQSCSHETIRRVLKKSASSRG